MNTTPSRMIGSATSVRPLGRSPNNSHAAIGDDDDLKVAQDGGKAGPDQIDRVVPEDQVAGEEDARERGQADRCGDPSGRAACTALDVGRGKQDGQCPRRQRKNDAVSGDVSENL